jgi:hypothetical protein
MSECKTVGGWTFAAWAGLMIIGPSIAGATALYHADGGLTEIFNNTVVRDRGTYSNDSSLTAAGGGVTYDPKINDPSTMLDYNFAANATSQADIFGLHCATAVNSFQKTSVEQGDNVDYQLRGGAFASGKYSDVVLPGPAGNVLTSLNLFIEGAVNASGTIVPLNELEIDGSVHIDVHVEDALGNQYLGTGGDAVDHFGFDQPGFTTYGTDGMLTNFPQSGAGLITTPQFIAPANTPLIVSLALQCQFKIEDIHFDNTFDATAQSNFPSTLQFNPDGPVFNLPAGYTANSADAGIVDNMFVAPEPSVGGALGLLALVNLRRTRRRE